MNDILTLGVLVIGGYLIYTKTDWFQQGMAAVKDIFADIKGGGGISRGGGAAPATGGGGGGGDIGGGNLGAAKGSFMYPGTGKTFTAVDSGKTTRNYASGKASTGTTQWDAKNVGGVVNIETDLWVNVGSCGDSVSTKVFGPSHSGSNCCWVIMNVDCASGNFELGSEGPHPTTNSSNIAKGQSMGSIKNKEVGIKLVVMKTGSGYTAKGYGNTGSGWKEYISANFTEWGVNKKSSTPHGSATIQFRTDCSGVKYTVARAQEITGGASVSAGAGVGAAVKGEASIPKKSNYTNTLFTVNKPLPLGYYNSRMVTALPVNQPFCDQISKDYEGDCYDRND